MTKRTTAVVLIGTLLSLPATAGHKDRPYDWAKVVSSTPIYKEARVVTPQRECWMEQVVYESEERRGGLSATPILVGATIGGVLGNEIGHKGKSKRVGTVVGALLGGSIGHDISRRHHKSHSRHRREYRDEERCEVRDIVTWEEQLKGYDVKYSYNGRVYGARMNEEPGERIKVRVHVTPIF